MAPLKLQIFLDVKIYECNDTFIIYDEHDFTSYGF